MNGGGDLPSTRETVGTAAAAAPDQGQPRGERPDMALVLTRRLAEFQNRRSQMLVQARNLKNDLLTLQDENANLRMALHKERKKVDRARSFLDGCTSTRDVAQQPLPPAPRVASLQSAECRCLAAERSRSLSDDQGDAACLEPPQPLDCPPDLDADDSDLNDVD